MEKWENKNEIVCAECGCVVKREEAFEVNGELYCAECVVECYECGEVILKADGVYCAENDEIYCEHCAGRELVWCEHCESYALDINAHLVRTSRRGGYETWCENCIDNDAVECAECGEYCDTDICIYTRDGDYICPSCEDDYYYCEECNSYVHYDDWDSDEDMCYRCSERTAKIADYHAYAHSEKKTETVGECRPQWCGIWRGLGVELEVDRGDGGDRDAERETIDALSELSGALMFERDGSISSTHGFEIITQPHTEDAFYNMPWLDILAACISGGYRSHDGGKCGLHVHLSREYFGSTREKQEAPIAKLIRFYDLFYNEIVKVSRRDFDGARQWARPAETENADDARKIVKGVIYKDRYQAVNTRNVHTVEIRIMRGTLNYNSFMACIDFVLTTAKNARRVKWTQIRNAALWLKGLKPETVEYLKSRNAFINVI